jgi:hypothetical protein
MMYEPEQQTDSESSFINADSRLIAAASYLKGLHHADSASELMPQDARLLKAARRFYNSLSDEERLLIDSYSDIQLANRLNLKNRNRRFKTLCLRFVCQTGSESRFSILLPPEQAEEGRNTNEHYQRNSD